MSTIFFETQSQQPAVHKRALYSKTQRTKCDMKTLNATELITKGLSQAATQYHFTSCLQTDSNSLK